MLSILCACGDCPVSKDPVRCDRCKRPLCDDCVANAEVPDHCVTCGIAVQVEERQAQEEAERGAAYDAFVDSLAGDLNWRGYRL
jgi:hypothetical protein